MGQQIREIQVIKKFTGLTPGETYTYTVEIQVIANDAGEADFVIGLGGVGITVVVEIANPDFFMYFLLGLLFLLVNVKIIASIIIISDKKRGVAYEKILGSHLHSGDAWCYDFRSRCSGSKCGRY